MTLFGSGTIVYVVFVAAASIELYFFMMQRSALEISRAAGFSAQDSRRMLPPWYLIVWPAILTKWWAAISIGMAQHWAAAVILLAAVFVFQIVIPIPHRQYIGVFRRTLTRALGDAVQAGSGVESGIHAQLYAALFDATKDPRFNSTQAE